MNRRITDSELMADVTDRGLRVIGVDNHRPLRGSEFMLKAALSPRALAASTPARVRFLIASRSYSAKAAIMWK